MYLKKALSGPRYTGTLPVIHMGVKKVLKHLALEAFHQTRKLSSVKKVS